jgi:hypothetical protein
MHADNDNLPGPYPALRGRRVLVVEDEALVALLEAPCCTDRGPGWLRVW